MTWVLFPQVWPQTAVATALTNSTPAAVSATRAGKAQTALCPPAQTSATTMDDAWTGSVCATRASRGTTAASRSAQATAMTRGTVWTESACASRTSAAMTAASRHALISVSETGGVWTASASVTKGFMEKTVHLVNHSETSLQGSERMNIYIYVNIYKNNKTKIILLLQF